VEGREGREKRVEIEHHRPSTLNLTELSLFPQPPGASVYRWLDRQRTLAFPPSLPGIARVVFSRRRKREEEGKREERDEERI
jgi:hypothetical protein